MDRTDMAVEEFEPKSITPDALRDLHALMAAETLELKAVKDWLRAGRRRPASL